MHKTKQTVSNSFKKAKQIFIKPKTKSLKDKILKKVHRGDHKPHRTIFYDDVDFSGWWIKSLGKGTIACLRRGRSTIKQDKTYHLEFEKPNITGAKNWTISELHNYAKICRTREEL
jgi:spermidine/putrescine-binding protein